jgi:hypothetical protein
MTSTENQPIRKLQRNSARVGRPFAESRHIMAVLSCFVFQAGLAMSQSAGSVGAKPPTAPASTAPKKEAAANGKNTAASTILPSRFVGEAEYEPYINSLTAQLSMKVRTTDPFGQLQDPNAKPVIKSSVAKNTKRQVQVQTTPFPDIIKRISVNTIMPRERKFLIGPRTYKQGGSLSIIHRGKTILAQITDVSARQIDFRNSETGETATLRIEALPVGMTPGTNGIVAPGMSPDAVDAPLNLDVGEP